MLIFKKSEINNPNSIHEESRKKEKLDKSNPKNITNRTNKYDSRS